MPSELGDVLLSEETFLTSELQSKDNKGYETCEPFKIAFFDDNILWVNSTNQNRLKTEKMRTSVHRFTKISRMILLRPEFHQITDLVLIRSDSTGDISPAGNYRLL